MAALEAIAPFPEPVREAICATALHPELVARVAQVQRQSSAAFARLLGPYTPAGQRAIWELVRYPRLVDELAGGGPKSEEQITEILRGYPRQVHAIALRYGLREPDLLAGIAALNRRTNRRFEELLQAYPPSTQESVRILVQYPQALGLLSSDLDLVILLGEAYRREPDRVRQQVAQMQPEGADRPTERARALAREPAYPGEAVPAGRAAARYDYDLNGLEGPDDDVEVNVVYDGYHTVPYWSGYPRWYYPPEWYAGLGWYLTPRVSATIGIGAPLIRRAVPAYHPYYPVYTGRYRHVAPPHRQERHYRSWR
jgi:hypothetical protein